MKYQYSVVRYDTPQGAWKHAIWDFVTHGGTKKVPISPNIEQLYWEIGKSKYPIVCVDENGQQHFAKTYEIRNLISDVLYDPATD